MYLHDFVYKLRRLHRDLYVNREGRRHVSGDWYTTGVYLKNAGGTSAIKRIDLAPIDAQKRIQDQESGQRDRFIMGVPLQWVPEHTIFDKDSGTILARGWRTILMKIILEGIVPKSKVRKVFNCHSLGEADYDYMNYDQKLALARGKTWL